MKLGKTGHKILRRLFLVGIDCVTAFVASIISYWIVNGAIAWTSLSMYMWAVVNAILLVAVFSVMELYSIALSSISVGDSLRIIFGGFIVLIANVVFALIVSAKSIAGFRVGLAVVYGGLVTCAILCIRFSKRFLVSTRSILRKRDGTKKRRVMVIGGGDAGAMLVKEMLTSDKIAYLPVCILDDNPAIIGQHILHVKIAGDTSMIRESVNRYDVEEIFIAMPSAPKKRVSEIISAAQETKLPVKVVPGIYQFVNGKVSVSSLRKVEIADLLGREQVTVNLSEIMGYISDKVVLVTGGGGSIGSELCRQIARSHPKQLIILDIYENNAYDIEQELKRNCPECNLLTLIASIRDERKVRDVFEKYRPQIVFNAAAHKHVPLMETSPNEAVKNNVFGTLNVARAADKYGVETFVQISTDKAVNPTNIMGATKRICEMIIQTIGAHSEHTKFVAVRFGNVLGSNGSVIPLFKRQIEEGGPITLTHKDIIRYFMTIPEAVSLVLQAGAYAKGGQIFVLDMGEPVKIYDLAYNLIKLSGLEPGVDIEIVETGLRPGEKLFEERLMAEEGLQKTANGSISIAKPIPLDEEIFWATLEKLNVEAHEETENMKESVKILVPTYTIDKRD
ncbi:MAG: polysaccharide biosynthesis protein [Clostridiales bacterium]|nr:polysaccharide biosynthesis protein [Clostridiales bacterium]